MPQIFDNLELKLLEGLHAVFPAATAYSFCVGCLNLRGWDQLTELFEGLPGGDEAQACRLLVGMQRTPEEQMKALAGLKQMGQPLDCPTSRNISTRLL